ncbi:single-stranded DNA-binding protein [Fischerella sp. PCC 9605]|uniref:single-stranded DNA-binding protein n=1 Tax=Fischerella sp. PCC 9605 TaxID=1173024 RepID=UPI0004789AF2|nr:single-stranded DNA-binding protein [Fischerella sp. PCC 9605]
MTPEQTHTWLQIQQRQMLALEKMAVSLERMTAALDRLSPRTAPNYQFPLEQFKSFDWSAIGATVERKDQYGAAIVSWGGQQFTRRSPANKYEPAVWFSRCVGKGDDGNNLYERLVTFKPLSKSEVEPVPEKVSRLMGTQ